MKKLNKLMIGLVMLSLMSQSCKKSFIDVNTNPNNLNNTLPQYLFSGATVDIGDASRAQVMARYNFMVFMQYLVVDGTDATKITASYDDPSSNSAQADAGVSYYQDYYSGIGIALNRIEAQIAAMPADEKATYSNLNAICQILNTYYAWQVTDIFGAMPYSQAFQSAKYPLPEYDYDFTLYKTFDDQLKAAATALKSPPAGQIALGVQDFYYGGDIPSWLAFANTLRIKIAQRHEKRDAANLTTVLNDIHTNFDDNIISTNTQSFGVSHSKNYNTDTDDIDAILNVYDAGYAFVEFLKSTNDPRLGLLVRQNDLGTNSAAYINVKANADAAGKAFLAEPANMVRYYGKHAFPQSVDASYGLTGAGRFYPFTVGTGTVSLDYLSVIQGRYFVRGGGFIGNIYQSQNTALQHTDETYPTDLSTIPMRTLWLSYGNTCFMMAEIAQKSGGTALSKSATEWYNAGVQASFDQYKTVGTTIGVPNAANVSIGDYLSRFPYDGTLQRIYSQAWVHLMVEPEEAYAMWKRTGYPKFVDYRAGQPTTPGNIGDGSGTAYMENIWTGSTNLVIPRRMHFGTDDAGAPLNITNVNKAITTMQAKDISYGASGLDTKGRIWWDQQ
jgi:hypothetical protein